MLSLKEVEITTTENLYFWEWKIQKELVETMDNVNRPLTYKEEVAQYTKKDAIHAIVFFAAIILYDIVVISVVILFNLLGGLWIAQAFKFIPLTLLFLYLRKRKQGLRSVGIHLMDWKKALAVGSFLLFAFLMFSNGLLSGLLGGWQMRPANLIIEMIVILLFAAFYEDVLFVGFFQTRIYGLIKKDWLAVALGAFFFAALHYPMLVNNAIQSAEGFGFDFWNNFVLMTVVWIVMHILIFNIIFRHLRSIIPVTLAHFAWNFAMFGSLWMDGYDSGFFEQLSMPIAIGTVMLIVWLVLPLFKKHKTAK